LIEFEAYLLKIADFCKAKKAYLAKKAYERAYFAEKILKFTSLKILNSNEHLKK